MQCHLHQWTHQSPNPGAQQVQHITPPGVFGGHQAFTVVCICLFICFLKFECLKGGHAHSSSPQALGLICSFRYLLSTYYIAGTVLGIRDISTNKPEHPLAVPCAEALAYLQSRTPSFFVPIQGHAFLTCLRIWVLCLTLRKQWENLASLRVILRILLWWFLAFIDNNTMPFKKMEWGNHQYTDVVEIF